MSWILSGLLTVALLGTLGETLWWWYIWHRHSCQASSPQSSWTKAIVFLTGISDYASVTLQAEQTDFLQQIGDRYPVDVLLKQPFPYEYLTAQKFARFEIWRHLGFNEHPLWTTSLHNFWQTILATWFEKAYGAGVGRCIINRIGLPLTPHNSTLVLICGSAGAAYALAAAPTLKLLQIRVIIITYGGVFSSAAGFDSVDKFYQLISEKDQWARLGNMALFRLGLFRGALEKAKQENRFSLHYIGKHKHMEYLSDRSLEPNGKTYRELTLDAMLSLPIWQDGFEV